jgi:hypothetical protein
LLFFAACAVDIDGHSALRSWAEASFLSLSPLASHDSHPRQILEKGRIEEGSGSALFQAFSFRADVVSLDLERSSCQRGCLRMRGGSIFWKDSEFYASIYPDIDPREKIWNTKKWRRKIRRRQREKNSHRHLESTPFGIYEYVRAAPSPAGGLQEMERGSWRPSFKISFFRVLRNAATRFSLQST